MYENVRIDGTVRIENAPEAPVEKPYLKTPTGIANAGILVRLSYYLSMFLD